MKTIYTEKAKLKRIILSEKSELNSFKNKNNEEWSKAKMARIAIFSAVLSAMENNDSDSLNNMKKAFNSLKIK